MNNNKIVQKYKVIGTNITVYAVYEPTNTSKQFPFYSHSTITHINNKCYGRLGTRELPEEINNIPVGDERFKKVDEHHNRQYQEAYNIILTEYPVLKNKNIRYDMGEIEEIA